MNFVYALLTLIGAQVLVWFQLNGQFIWEGFKTRPALIALIFAFPISWLFITYQKYAYLIFSESLWSIRMFGYGVGIIVFLLMTFLIAGETLNLKNGICLLLSLCIVLVQAFVK